MIARKQQNYFSNYELVTVWVLWIERALLIVWWSSLSVPQLLDSPLSLLTNRGTMLWDKLCWLLALLALSSGGLPPPSEPLSAPRIFLSFKGKTLKIMQCLWPSWCSSVFLFRHADLIATSVSTLWFLGLTAGTDWIQVLASLPFVPSVVNTEFDCVIVWERLDEGDEEMRCWLSWLFRVREYVFIPSPGCSLFPKQAFFVTSALFWNQVRFNTWLSTNSGYTSSMLWMLASAIWDPVCVDLSR